MTCSNVTESQHPLENSLIAPFATAVALVFRTMVGVEVTCDPPRVKAEHSSSHDICGIIGISGELNGSFVIGMEAHSAERLVERFAGAKLARESADFADAVGEIANMIAGAAKRDLGATASISTPSVVLGNRCSIASPKNAPCFVFGCRSLLGNFVVEVCIRRNVP